MTQHKTGRVLRVRLLSPHPHAGETGKLVPGDRPDMLQGIRVSGTFMALVELDNDLVVARCYAAREHLAVLNDEDWDRRVQLTRLRKGRK